MKKNKMGRQFIFFTTVSLLTALNSCKLGLNDEPIVIADIEKEFQIEMREEFSPANRAFNFKITSIQEEDCLNATIATNTIVQGQSISLSIDRIVSPEVCIEGKAPASALVDVSKVKDGFYNLTIDLKNTIFNNGQLVADEESYKMTLLSSKGIQINNKTLLRIPDRTLWGFIHYADQEDQFIADQFYEQLNNQETPLQLKSGYYGHFTVDQNDLTIPDQPEDQLLTFALRQNTPSEKLKVLINQYREDFGDRIQISILNTEGIVF